jgi:Mn-dependent DtxR family transcriptional regulator
LGQTGDQGLTAVQKRIYNYIKEKGRVKSEELPGVLGLSPREVEVQFAVLRHCGLVGAKKEEDGIYVTPLG